MPGRGERGKLRTALRRRRGAHVRDILLTITHAPVDRTSRLAPTATVALVVATSESSAIGIGPPVLTASTNRSISDRWPLSWPPRAFAVLRRRPAQTSALRKLSSRAFRPPPVASSVSLG